MLSSCQRISSGPRRFETFRNNKKFLRWVIVGPTPNPQAGGPHLVGCPRLLIQYIFSYPPYPQDFPPSAPWGCAMPWWQGRLYCLKILVTCTFKCSIRVPALVAATLTIYALFHSPKKQMSVKVKVNVKLKLFLCLGKHHAMNMCLLLK
jgi:hypothetical protein